VQFATGLAFAVPWLLAACAGSESRQQLLTFDSDGATAEAFSKQLAAKLATVGEDVTTIVIRWPVRLIRDGEPLGEDEAHTLIVETLCNGPESMTNWLSFDDRLVGVGERAIRFHRGACEVMFDIQGGDRRFAYIQDAFRRHGIPFSLGIANSVCLDVPLAFEAAARRVVEQDPALAPFLTSRE
jgi:hypothetical protein